MFQEFKGRRAPIPTSASGYVLLVQLHDKIIMYRAYNQNYDESISHEQNLKQMLWVWKNVESPFDILTQSSENDLRLGIENPKNPLWMRIEPHMNHQRQPDEFYTYFGHPIPPLK